MHVHQLIAWLQSMPWKAFAKYGLGVLVSAIALLFVLYDRRPRLTLRARKGAWYTLTPTMSDGEVIFRGVIEVYNQSNRANAIRGYRFRCQMNEEWKDMESEFYKNMYRFGEPEESEPELANRTPLTLAPYSGEEIHVQAIVKIPRQNELPIQIEIEDLFGKHYCVQVKAVSGTTRQICP